MNGSARAAPTDLDVLAGAEPSAPSAGGARGIGLFLLRRVASGVVVLALASMMVFAATQALPGDTAAAILGRDATPQRTDALRAQLGLDEPLVEQYVSWVGRLVRGDLGTSLASREPVRDSLAAPVRNSAALLVVSGVVSLPLAIGIGVWSALRRGRRTEHAVSAVMVVLASLPEFVIGVAVIILFATGVFQWFPAVSFLDEGATPWSDPAVLVLPALSIVLLVVPYVSRMVRAATTEVLESEYVEMARLKGVSERRVITHHVLPNVMAPISQVSALVLAVIAGGSVVIETLFAYPGVGLELVTAVRLRDLPVIQVLTLGVGLLYLLLSVTADVTSLAFTPRARTAAR